MGPEYRTAALRRLAEHKFDVLVVGGGVVGAGAALDAASRGLSVALLEAQDWAAGTSSRSSKLIHGGLRYLEQRDFALVREALRERSLLLSRLAPHLVRPVPFLYPLRHRLWERLYVGAGVTLYDTMGGARILPRHRQLSKRRALAIAPALRAENLIGAIQYYDAQVDDARLVVALVRTAARYGAVVATRTRVTRFRREDGKVVGAELTDLESGAEIAVRARQVVNATGVWTEEAQQLAEAPSRLTVRASKGVHVTVPRDRIAARTGLIVRTEKSVLFVIPWDNHWLIGTTDTEWRLDKANPTATSADIDYILEQVNSVLTDPLGRDDIDGVFAGLRPLLAGDSDETTRLSREHTVTRPAPGLVVIAGGKYTTYRVMARDAIDVAVQGFAEDVPESITDQVPVLGADGYRVLWNSRARLATGHGLPVAVVEHLLGRYGSSVEELLALIDGDPELAEPLPGATRYLKAEVVYAASHEGARRLVDVLSRRTRISFEQRDRGVAAAPEAARLVAPVLGWDTVTTRREIERYLDQVAAERAAEQQPDDASANQARQRPPGESLAS
ncbi:MAG: glycerol-3-phosphate dehydrogenase [Micromonosporaceae bacterium]